MLSSPVRDFQLENYEIIFHQILWTLFLLMTCSELLPRSVIKTLSNILLLNFVTFTYFQKGLSTNPDWSNSFLYLESNFQKNRHCLKNCSVLLCSGYSFAIIQALWEFTDQLARFIQPIYTPFGHRLLGPLNTLLKKKVQNCHLCNTINVCWLVPKMIIFCSAVALKMFVPKCNLFAVNSIRFLYSPKGRHFIHFVGRCSWTLIRVS